MGHWSQRARSELAAAWSLKFQVSRKANCKAGKKTPSGKQSSTWSEAAVQDADSMAQ